MDSFTLTRTQTLPLKYSGHTNGHKHSLLLHKETTLERADFTLLLQMFVTAEKERVVLIKKISPVFVSCCISNKDRLSASRR